MCLRNRGWIRCLERLIFPRIQRKGHEPGESALAKFQVKNEHLYSLYEHLYSLYEHLYSLYEHLYSLYEHLYSLYEHLYSLYEHLYSLYEHLYSLYAFMALPGTTLPVSVQVLTYLTTLRVPFTVP